MSGTSPDPPPGAPTVCLGEVRVDFICERPLEDVAHGQAFVPHFGGAVANVAVTAARHGAHVALASGAGDDPWGRWLRDRLERERIELSLFERVEAAIGGAAGLYFSSDTLVGPEERELAMRARERALTLGRPVVFDPGLRLERWRCEDDPDRAALALLKAGARMVVITLGSEGAILRGELRLDVDGCPANVVSTIGAGDALAGVLLARLATSGYYPAAVAASLPDAVAESARACERWGALE